MVASARAIPPRLADQKISNARELGALFVADARAGGNTVFGGEAPHVWAGRLVQKGAIDLDVAAALVALILGSGDPATVAEAARLGAKLPPSLLQSLFPAAIDAQDTGVLLHPDPFLPSRSVEDALLAAWADTAPESLGVRALLLDRLRNAGLPDLEVALLARRGTPEEIGATLPQVFLEGVPPGTAEALTPLLSRGDEVMDAFGKVLRSLSKPVLAEIARRNPALAGR